MAETTRHFTFLCCALLVSLAGSTHAAAPVNSKIVQREVSPTKSADMSAEGCSLSGCDSYVQFSFSKTNTGSLYASIKIDPIPTTMCSAVLDSTTDPSVLAAWFDVTNKGIATMKPFTVKGTCRVIDPGTGSYCESEATFQVSGVKLTPTAKPFSETCRRSGPTLTFESQDAIIRITDRRSQVSATLSDDVAVSVSATYASGCTATDASFTVQKNSPSLSATTSTSSNIEITRLVK